MGNQKQRWTAEEEEALKAGVAKHGVGKWKNILVDEEFAPALANRSNVDLKDKWRNMGAIHGHGCTSTPKVKVTTSTAVIPLFGTSSSVCSSIDKALDSPPPNSQDDKIIPKYSTMILEALSSLNEPSGSDLGAIASFIEQRYKVPQNFRRQLSSKLRRLVLQAKLEKVLQCYKIKDSGFSAKSITPTQQDVRQRPLQQSSVIFPGQAIEVAAATAAQCIAEAENKASVAAEAFKEADRVAQLAEDTNTIETLYEEFHEQCSRGGFVLLD